MLARSKTRAADELHSNAEVQHDGTHCRALPGLELADLLSEALVCIATPSASEAKLLERLETLRERLAVSRFQLAVLGQFKRGKSTLLNALLGADVLPTGVIPVTAIPTFLQFAPGWRIRVTFGADRTEQSEVDGPSALRERLAEIVTAAANPHNRLGVTRVDVFLPSRCSRAASCWSIHPALDRRLGTTRPLQMPFSRNVMPLCSSSRRIPPISEVEVEFLARVRKTVARLIIVLNKIDTLESEDRVTAAAFLRRVGGVGPVPSQRNASRAIPATIDRRNRRRIAAERRKPALGDSTKCRGHLPAFARRIGRAVGPESGRNARSNGCSPRCTQTTIGVHRAGNRKHARGVVQVGRNTSSTGANVNWRR
jgi:hypothetical protein